MSDKLFSNVAQNDPLSFFSRHGLRNPKDVARFLELNDKDVSKIAGVKKSSVRWDERIPPIVVTRLKEIANVCSLVAGFFDGDAQKTSLWFQTPNPMLGSITPRDMLRFGRYKKLMEFVVAAIDVSNPSDTQAKT